MSSPFLKPEEPPEEQATWAPISYVSPCFTHYRADDATVKCLTKTQIALHEQRLLYESLLAQAVGSKNEWDRTRSELEEQLRHLQVRNAEAERLYKIQEQKLDTRLHDTQRQLEKLTHEHKHLKEASTDKIQELQSKISQLQNACDDLEAERKALATRLRDAEVTAVARREAERRVRELEAAITAVKDRAQAMISELRTQRDEAERTCAALRDQLTGTQRTLVAEQRARQGAETQALSLAIAQQRLAAALDLERLINEPLRHTNHATTTVAHVMRSMASPIVADRSRIPVYTNYASPPPPRGVETRPDISTVPRPGASIYPVGMPAEAADSMNGTYLTHVFASPVRGAAPGVVSSMAPDAASASMHETAATYVPSPQLITVSRPDLSHSISGEALTRLGRAWATTTPTAGHPHPVYLDNIPRYSPFYHSELTRTRPASAGMLHPQSAPRRVVAALGDASGKGARVATTTIMASPTSVRTSRPRTAASPASMRTPSRALVESYHAVAGGQPRHSSAHKGVRGREPYSPSPGRPSPGPPSSRATVAYSTRSP